jgi:hypothetical protein
MDSYATPAELTARLSPAYTAPSGQDALIYLQKASELINYATLGRAQILFTEDDPDEDILEVLSTATCDQVEFWLEAGEEHDVVGLPKGSSLQGGRVQVQRMPGYLGQRARRTLIQAGLTWAGGRSI